MLWGRVTLVQRGVRVHKSLNQDEQEDIQAQIYSGVVEDDLYVTNNAEPNMEADVDANGIVRVKTNAKDEKEASWGTNAHFKTVVALNKELNIVTRIRRRHNDI